MAQQTHNFSAEQGSKEGKSVMISCPEALLRLHSFIHTYMS